MFDLIQRIMENGYADEHGHVLYGASAIAHFMNRPINSIGQREIEAGRKYVQKYFNQ